MTLSSAISATLQVSIDCSPQQLLEYLHGAAATEASVSAAAVHQAKAEEERLLEAASNALGTQTVMRFIPRHQQPDICGALERLISSAEAVRQAWDMSGGYPDPAWLAICPRAENCWHAKSAS